jgi:hypothetical protein
VTPAPEDCPSAYVGLLADLGDLSVGVVASGLRASVAGVGAGLAGGFQRGRGVVPGGADCRGGPPGA